MLTEIWSYEISPIQKASPAALVAQTLQKVLGASLRSYTFVDFCAGGGGPTPLIERETNSRSSNAPEQGAVDFILTDLHPHLLAWQTACKASPSKHLRYVPVPIDATSATAGQVLESAQPPLPLSSRQAPKAEERRVFRLFNLAFHHFDDEVAVQVLRNTLETSNGFAIFELQGRDWGSLFTVLLLWPFLVLGSYWWYLGDWTNLFLHGIVPVVPGVIVFDGWVSCLRTRTAGEIDKLLQRAAAGIEGRLDGWTFQVGREVHTWPFGKMSYFIGTKE